MAHMDSERNSCQEPELSKWEKHETNLQCDMVARRAGWLTPAHTEISPRVWGDALPIPWGYHTTTNHHLPGDHGQRWDLSSLVTTLPWVQDRIVLRRERGLWVQAASLETEDWYSPGNGHSQLVLTYLGVLSVSIKIAGGSFIPHLWRRQDGTKPMPSRPPSTGLSRPGF